MSIYFYFERCFKHVLGVIKEPNGRIDLGRLEEDWPNWGEEEARVLTVASERIDCIDGYMLLELRQEVWAEYKFVSCVPIGS